MDTAPISHEDMVPYYEKVQRYAGISGRAENLPQLSDSGFLPEMEMTGGEELLRASIESKVRPRDYYGHCAVLTKAHDGRQACHYCGPCERGCITHSYFSSVTTTLPDTVVMKDGKAVGISYVGAGEGVCALCVHDLQFEWRACRTESTFRVSAM